MLSGDAASGVEVTIEQQIGRGSRARPVVNRPYTYPLRGYVTGRDALQRSEALRRALDKGRNILVHPWQGALDVIPTEWRLAFDSQSLEWVELDLEFTSAVLPELAASEPPPDAGTTLSAMAQAGAAFASEPVALAELEQLRPELSLEPPSVTGEGFATQATGQLLNGSGVATGVPRALQEVGNGVRAAEAGELTSDEAARIEAALLVEADRSDSATLLDIRELFSIFVAGSALARVQTANGPTIQALAEATGQSIEILAARNRQAVLQWFARGEVRV